MRLDVRISLSAAVRRRGRYTYPSSILSSFTFLNFVFSRNTSLFSASALSFSTSETLISSQLGPVQRFRARVAYDGAGFEGFQLQEQNDFKTPKRTVQLVLEKALNLRLFGKLDLTDDEYEKEEDDDQETISQNDQDDSKKDSYTSSWQEQRKKRKKQRQRQKKQLGKNFPDENATPLYPRVIKVVAAGRTDAGVHARGQAIHFDVPFYSDILEKQMGHPDQLKLFERSLNFSFLPPDVRLWNLHKVPPPRLKPNRNLMEKQLDDDGDDYDGSDRDEGIECEANKYAWNVLYDSTHKLYSYRLCLSNVNRLPMDPLDRHTRWQPDFPIKMNLDPESMEKRTPQPTMLLDVKQLERLLKLYEGTHDFLCFCNASSERKNIATQTKNTVRTVYSVKLVQEYPTADPKWDCRHYYYRIDFDIKGALYKQVRNMVGTALAVCVVQGASNKPITEEHFRNLLQVPPCTKNENGESRRLDRRDNPSKPAPAHGLAMEYVFFDENEEDLDF